jgi:hypothetical protein
MSSTITICDGVCRVCCDHNLGTFIEHSNPHSASDFVCANCDPLSFEMEGDLQKERYLAGADFDQHGVY